MAVNKAQYAREFERSYAKTSSAEKAHKTAVKRSTMKKKPKKKETWVSRLKRNVQMVLKGPKYYSSIGGKHAKKSKPVKTTRTKAVEKGLRAGGLTEKEIARLRGKK